MLLQVHPQFERNLLSDDRHSRIFRIHRTLWFIFPHQILLTTFPRFQSLLSSQSRPSFLSSLKHAAVGLVTLLEQLHQLSGKLGDLIVLVTDESLEFESFVHLIQGLLDERHALVKAVGGSSGKLLEVTLVVIAHLLVEVDQSLDADDAFGKISNVGVVDLLDGLGDTHGVGLGHVLDAINDGRHLGCDGRLF